MSTTNHRFFSLALSLALAGCAHESVASKDLSDAESNKDAWLSGQTHEQIPVFSNADGTASIGSQTTTTRKDGTTIIVRERKTTNEDGTVTTDRETRTIIPSTEKVASESSTSH